MDIDRPTPLLGGLSPATFMRRHWQKKPLLVRGALADPLPGFDRRRLFALAARDDVESRLVVRRGGRWSLRPGPLPRRALPSLATPAWSVLVQGVAQVVDDPVAVRRCENLDLAPAPGDDPTACWIGIRPDEISGRQIPLYRFS